MADNILHSPGIKITETDRSFVTNNPIVAGAALVGPTVKGDPYVPTVVTSWADYKRTFGTTFKMGSTFTSASAEATASGASAYKTQEYLTSIAAKSYFDQGGQSLLVVRVVSGSYSSATASILNSASSGNSLTLYTIAKGEEQNSNGVSGSINNVKVEIADKDEELGTFSIYVRRGDDTDNDKVILESFSNLDLDPNSDNYVARRIGDMHSVLHKEENSVAYLDVAGNFPNVSKYIYVGEVDNAFDYVTYNESGSPETSSAKKAQLPSESLYTFSNAKGSFTFDAQSKSVFFDEIKDNSLSGKLIQGIPNYEYDYAFNVLSNEDEYVFNVISAPGLTDKSFHDTLDTMVSLVEGRGDAMAVVDLAGFGAAVKEVANQANSINSNYAATYYPWLQVYSETGRLEWVPASTVIPGVYAYTDRVAAPWFAPAGMSRGSLANVVRTEKKLLKDDRDALYKKNVNPISILPGNGITIYGQKTLQKKATALDRVNVRRLMIELKDYVKKIAGGLLFEQNTAALRNQFKGNLDNYLESVVQRRGLYAYKTVVDDLNTPDVIDRNEFRCQIYVQPTKVIEYIYIDFTVTNTGVEFNN